MKNKEKGFTLIELLVVVAIIGILATVVIVSVGRARIKAKDAAIVSRLSSIRTDIELDYASGNYAGLCSSTLFTDLEDYVGQKGGDVTECTATVNSYRIAAYDASGNPGDTSLPSGIPLSSLGSVHVAHAQRLPIGLDDGNDLPIDSSVNSMSNGFCVNSNGFASRINIADLRDLVGESFCTLEEKADITGIVPCGGRGEPECPIRRTCQTIVNPAGPGVISVPTSCFNFETLNVEPASACDSLPPYPGGCR